MSEKTVSSRPAARPRGRPAKGPDLTEDILDIQKRCLSQLRQVREDQTKLLEKFMEVKVLLELLTRGGGTPQQQVVSVPQGPLQQVANPPGLVVPNVVIPTPQQPPPAHGQVIAQRAVTPTPGTAPQSGVVKQPKILLKEGFDIKLGHGDALGDAMAMNDMDQHKV